MKWQYIHVSIFTRQYIWETEVVPMITSSTQVMPVYASYDACRVVGWIIRQTGDK